jgi:hypothetical protein
VYRRLASALFAPSNVDPEPVHHAAIATDDGTKLAFTSTLPLTGFDNTDAASALPCGVKEGVREGVCDSEIFLYEAGSTSLVCISCNPTGAAPEGRAVEIVPNAGIKVLTAAALPLAKNQLYRPRVFDAPGKRLFFNSFDSLSPRDVNSRMDVYEWQAATGRSDCVARGAETYVAASGGCLSLISGGEGTTDSEFLDASASGRDVFFSTDQSLLSQDPGQVDVYDARMGGGFPLPTKPVACEGDGCQQSMPTPPPPTVGSRSASPISGNKGRPSCRKGMHRVTRKGRTRCVKKKMHKGKNKKSGGVAR